MAPLTRRQSIDKESNMTKQAPEDELPQHTEPVQAFSKLPVELQKTVVEYLAHSADLQSLCLVSKELHTLTLPYLYRDITLKVHQLDADLPLTSSSSHPGLSHTRSLRIRERGSCLFDLEEHSRALYQLLSLLPKNRLRVFELTTKSELDQRLGMFLRITQQKLINYQYHSLKSTISMFTPSSDELNHVTCLQIYLRSEKDCRNARILLERAVCVTSLEIELSRETLDFDVGRGQEVGRYVINTLFSSKNATLTGLKLRRLRIRSMSFCDAGTILPTVLPCEELEYLHLLSCSNTDRLCESLSHLKLSLRSFCDENHNAHRDDSHATFLKSLPPLQTVRLTGSYCLATLGHEGFPWPVIVPHASSLRCLEIDEYYAHQNRVASMGKIHPSFREFCASASNLQQLSIPGPEIERSAWAATGGLHVMLGCVRKIRTLRLLKLAVAPKCLSDEILDGESDYEPEECERAKQLANDMQDFKIALHIERAKDQARAAADLVFDSLVPCCPWFVALALDLNTEHDSDSMCSVEFLRSKQIDLFGKTSYVGRPVEQGTIKYYEPCSDVLEDLPDEDLLKYD